MSNYIAVVPPCTPFSCAGLGAGDSDPRSLVDHSLDFISEYQPAAVMMENVPGLAKKRHKVTMDRILRCFRENGYKAKHRLLNTTTHGGLPHNRCRL